MDVPHCVECHATTRKENVMINGSSRMIHKCPYCDSYFDENLNWHSWKESKTDEERTRLMR